MRIFVVELLGTGGMAHYIYQFCTALADCGADVTLVTTDNYEMATYPHNFAVEPRLRLWPHTDPHSSQPPQTAWGRRWHQVGWTVRRGQRAWLLLAGWLWLARFLLHQRPDVVQFGKINFPFEALFLRYLRYRGLVLTQICHEFELRERTDGLLAGLINRMYASVYPTFAALFFHADNNRQRFLSLFDVPAAKTYLIPHGNEDLFLAAYQEKVDLRRRYGIGPDQPVVLFFGNIMPSKGVPDLLRAFALVRQQTAVAHLVVAGYPTKFVRIAALQQLVAELGVTDSVTLDLRYIPMAEVGALMEMACVVVYPYHTSTQSGALQVAYTFGRPVIATAVGGLPEAVDEGRSGLLVPPQDPAALAEAIRQMVGEPQRAAEMAAYARHLAETRFAWKPIAQQVLAVYSKLSS